VAGFTNFITGVLFMQFAKIRCFSSLLRVALCTLFAEPFVRLRSTAYCVIISHGRTSALAAYTALDCIYYLQSSFLSVLRKTCIPNLTRIGPQFQLKFCPTCSGIRNGVNGCKTTFELVHWTVVQGVQHRLSVTADVCTVGWRYKPRIIAI